MMPKIDPRGLALWRVLGMPRPIDHAPSKIRTSQIQGSEGHASAKSRFWGRRGGRRWIGGGSMWSDVASRETQRKKGDPLRFRP